MIRKKKVKEKYILASFRGGKKGKGMKRERERSDKKTSKKQRFSRWEGVGSRSVIKGLEKKICRFMRRGAERKDNKGRVLKVTRDSLKLIGYSVTQEGK